MPSPLRAESVAISEPSCPLWVTTASDPGVKCPHARRSSLAESTSPSDPGPMRRAPAAVIASASSSACGTRVEMMRKARTPRSSASVTTPATAVPGMETTRSSGTSGRSRSRAHVRSPWIEVARALTRKTRRRSAPVSAPAASQNPHFAGSFEAPRTATLRGSKNTSTSDLPPAR
ncbi:Uncharacterised protein [Mycobacteroides abscessus subsp. abscessus]|nr:Uncharacterised protein [Mycobacteroides abscessus subsp. abscessus]